MTITDRVKMLNENMNKKSYGYPDSRDVEGWKNVYLRGTKVRSREFDGTLGVEPPEHGPWGSATIDDFRPGKYNQFKLG